MIVSFFIHLLHSLFDSAAKTPNVFEKWSLKIARLRNSKPLFFETQLALEAQCSLQGFKREGSLPVRSDR